MKSEKWNEEMVAGSFTMTCEARFPMRCGCYQDAGGMLHPTGNGGSVVECCGCGATWLLLAEQTAALDLRPFGGEVLHFLTPNSEPVGEIAWEVTGHWADAAVTTPQTWTAHLARVKRKAPTP